MYELNQNLKLNCRIKKKTVLADSTETITEPITTKYILLYIYIYIITKVGINNLIS